MTSTDQTPSQQEMRKLMSDMERLLFLMEERQTFKFPSPEKEEERQRLLALYPDLGDVIEKCFAYIRALEKEHRIMRNELECIHDGDGNWATDVLRSITLNP